MISLVHFKDSTVSMNPLNQSTFETIKLVTNVRDTPKELGAASSVNEKVKKF